jgi:NitT/TauT family transport system substrate-binding protein
MLRFSILRAVAIAAALLGLAASGALAPARAQALTAVSYGILNYTGAEWPLILAQDEGFFKKAGITVSVVSLSTPPNVINALASGAVNVGEDGTDSIIAAVSRNLPIKIVAPIFAADPYSLVVAPSITSIEQLKGKTIMLGTKQDVTAITLAAMLKPYRLTLDDFSIVVAGSTPARYQALLSGNAQGSMLLQPFDLLAESQGYHILGNSGHDTLKNWLFTTLAVNTAWASANKPAVVAMIKALREGVQYGATHKAEAIKSLIAYTKTTPEIAEKTYNLYFGQWKVFDDPAVTATQLDDIAKAQIAFGVITKAPTFAELYDGSYAAAAR